VRLDPSYVPDRSHEDLRRLDDGPRQRVLYPSTWNEGQIHAANVRDKELRDQRSSLNRDRRDYY